MHRRSVCGGDVRQVAYVDVEWVVRRSTVEEHLRLGSRGRRIGSDGCIERRDWLFLRFFVVYIAIL